MDKGFKSTAWALSIAGIVPFILPVFWLYFANDDQQLVQRAYIYMVAYGAVILSFLGGIRWGYALTKNTSQQLILSVLPSLLAWVCLLAPPQYQLIGLLVGFSFQWLWDYKSSKSGFLPEWFGRLRLFISLCVATLFVLTIFAQFSA